MVLANAPAMVAGLQSIGLLVSRIPVARRRLPVRKRRAIAAQHQPVNLWLVNRVLSTGEA